MKRSTIAVGVDPGATCTGVVARRGDELLHAAVLDRRKLLDPLTDSDLPSRRKAWSRLVMVHVADLLDELSVVEGLGDVHEAMAAGRVVLAAENVTKPHPYGGLRDGRARVIDPGPILDTGVVLGRLLGGWDGLVLVDPGHNGGYPDYCYPEGIRRGRRNLGGPPEHARSAWDVAGAALVLARLTAVTNGDNR